MPHYFLHVRLPESFVTDPTGREFDDIEEAVCLANGLLRGLNLPQSNTHPYLPRVEICDPDGLITTVPILPIEIPLPGAGRA
jgi:hypothetical protein